MNPYSLIGIYLSGATIAAILFFFGGTVFASDTVSNASSAIIFYHAWCCLMFGLMLIFKTKDLWLTALQVESVDTANSINDRVGLQLTQICGAWVLAYAFLSIAVVFFVPNAVWVLFLLHLFAIFAQGSEVIIKRISTGSFGLGPIINTHHVVVQLVGLCFFLSAVS